MIVKFQYEGWKYYEGEEVQVTYGLCMESHIQDDVICLIPNMCPVFPPKDGVKAITKIEIINGSHKKIIFIPYNDIENMVTGYILNNEGKTIDRIN